MTLLPSAISRTLDMIFHASFVASSALGFAQVPKPCDISGTYWSELTPRNRPMSSVSWSQGTGSLLRLNAVPFNAVCSLTLQQHKVEDTVRARGGRVPRVLQFKVGVFGDVQSSVVEVLKGVKQHLSYTHCQTRPPP